MKQTHYRELLTLGIPIVIGQIGTIVLGFADTLMIGHHSATELAAASFVNNMINLAIIFSTGFLWTDSCRRQSFRTRKKSGGWKNPQEQYICQYHPGGDRMCSHDCTLSERTTSGATGRTAALHQALSGGPDYLPSFRIMV